MVWTTRTVWSLTELKAITFSVLLPESFTSEILGENWIDPDLLGRAGVGDLTKVGVKNVKCDDCGTSSESCVLDNRHIPKVLHLMLCGETQEGKDFRDAFKTLLEMAWPPNAEFWLCCSKDRTKIEACLEPDHVFVPPEGIPMAPHFLTTKFEAGQQEALTAALISKINVHGTTLKMDLAGRFDLGAAGVLTITRNEPDAFHHYLGNAWGNVFLDCKASPEDPLCAAAAEEDHFVGRHEESHNLPLFTCSGESSYPIKASGKSCSSEDMASNEAGGCDFVAAAGECDVVCVGGMCGTNQPFEEGRGSINVLYVYMDEYDVAGFVNGQILAIAIPAVLALLLATGLRWLNLKGRNPRSHSGVVSEASNVKESAPFQGTETNESVEMGA
ncbi:unknown protein [Seminavis robusta]|uniref:Uncharacterized protein n=1 Tax=Seminavis robusta TaxID=568900 RepID=A0A9N8HZE0_9STRA|nr:unknown protein [Seminavis robusta]|eukprot:Sro2876_g339160.1 n/a (387) ;mRNA; f:6584-7744